ncbi:MAG: phosphatase PAP2 family protein [Gemmatimonadota bacterium]
MNNSDPETKLRAAWRRPIELSLLCVIGLVGLIILQSLTSVLDSAVLTSVVQWRGPFLTRLMQAITWLGSGQAEFPFVFAFVGFLVWRNRRRDALEYFGWCLGGWVCYALLKTIIHRARPHLVERLSGGGWYSFPSGHAMLGPIIYVFAVMLILPSIERRSTRILLLGLSWLLVVLIAFSRVYLGVHYPTDVIGGLLAGFAWLGISLTAMRARQERVSRQDA